MRQNSYSDGSKRLCFVEVWEDLHNERSGYYRAFWVGVGPRVEHCGSPVIGYCSPGGSHRTIKAVAREVQRFYPGEPVYRNGKQVHA